MGEYYCVGDEYVREYVEQFIDAWMMIDCGLEESWIRRYTIGPFQCAYPVFCSWDNDKLLLEIISGQSGSCALMDNEEGGEIRSTMFMGFHLGYKPYLHGEFGFPRWNR